MKMIDQPDKQTPFAYCRRILSVRADQTSTAGADAPLAPAGTTGGMDTSPTPNPLLDTWNANPPSGAGGR